jgi:cytochrome c oxidase cbb3-type subunit III
MPKYKDELLEHDYDGIKEYNNKMPRWLTAGFIISFVWAVLYFAYYHLFGFGYLGVDVYKKEMNPDYVRVSKADLRVLGILPDYHSPFFNPYGDTTPYMAMASSRGGKTVFLTRETDTTTYIQLTDVTDIAVGKRIFLQNCVQCHGEYGQGIVGPNLTDDYWLHGGDFSSIVKTIRYGYPAKGMLAWLGVLKPEDIIKAASYVKTLHGTNPPNPKAPQGELVKE